MFNTRNLKNTDIIKTEAALRSIIRDQFPTLNVEEGSNLNDILVRALGYTVAVIKTEAEHIKTSLSLRKIQESSSLDKINMLEDLASNFLIFSRTSVPARGIITLRFSSSSNRTLPATILFIRGDDSYIVKPFDTTSDITILSTDLVDVTLEDGTVVYDYSLLTESTNDVSQESIVAGTFTTETSLPGLLSIFNTADFISFDPNGFQERDLSTRMGLALTARGFHTRTAINNTILEENIANVKRVIGIGAGDPEMQRDIVPTSVSGEEFHSLGMINVVCASDPQPKNYSGLTTHISSIPLCFIRKAIRGTTTLNIISDFTIDTSKKLRIVRYLDSTTGKTVVTSSSVALAEALPANSIQLTTTADAYKLKNGISITDKYSITYTAAENNSCDIEAAIDSNLAILQGLINTSTYNTLASDTLALGCTMVQLLIPKIEVEVIAGVNASTVSTNSIKQLIQDTVANWTEERPLAFIDILSPISILLGGTASNIDFTEGIQYLAYLPDGRELLYKSTSKLGVEDTTKQIQSDVFSAASLLDLQVSDRVLNYIIYPSDITIEVSNV